MDTRVRTKSKYTVKKKNAPVNRKKIKEMNMMFILPLAFLYIEWLSHLFLFGFKIDSGIIFTTLISLIMGTLWVFLICFLPQKARYTAVSILLIFTAFYYSAHMVYYHFFRMFFSFDALAFAGAVTEFMGNTIEAIFADLFKIIILFVPVILFFIFGKKYTFFPQKNKPLHRMTVLISISFSIIYLLLMFIPAAFRDRIIYIREDVPKTFSTYGIGVASIDDMLQSVFGVNQREIDNPYIDNPIPKETETNTSEETETDPKIEYGYNSLDINFENLIAQAPNDKIRSMHSYFSSVPPTRQNEYTGYFKGKNLVFLTLEGFSYKIIDKEITPTLYKMYNEGFKFTNFYDSLWGGSTASGEYSNMTGNMYDSAKCLEMTAGHHCYSTLANLFKPQSYIALAYHNHTYDYYHREISHPTFGYEYKAIGAGLKLEHSSWPNSDYDMAVATAPECIERSKNENKPFVAYYMTVSGHANYNFIGNSMSIKHKDVVSGLPYSEGVKAFIACQYEVELMLNELIRQYDAAGILDDTVFAMCCDHYPYALGDAELAELYGLPQDGIRSNLDLYRNGFLLWSSSMEKPVEVDTPCSSYDMVPTLANLFGIPYESRVIIGTDILSENENIAIINTLDAAGNRNWVTEQGTYYSKTGEFKPSKKCKLKGDDLNSYIEITKKKVDAMMYYGFNILNTDYYRYVFDESFQPLK